MARLGIFSVKIFFKSGDNYFTNGGFGLYLSEMCREFEHVDICCKVINRKPPKGFYLVPHENLRFHAVPSLKTEFGALIVQPLVAWRAVRLMPAVDIVHARMPDWTGLTGALIARLSNKPCFHQIIADWRGLADTIPWQRKFGLGIILKPALRLYDWLERRLSRNQLVFAQGVVAYQKHLPNTDAHLVLSSAHRDSDVIEPAPRFDTSRRTILNVGRLDAVKNQKLLIRALARLRSTDKRWELRIIGSGEHQAALERLAETLDVSDHVIFIGHVAHGPDLWSHYDSADIFALTSVSEGTPKVILEAMARGCPVVASRVSGVPTAVEHERRGLLFESEDLDGLVSSIERMATDDNLRRTCQQNGWHFAKDNSLENSTRFVLDRVAERWPHLRSLRRHHD